VKHECILAKQDFLFSRQCGSIFLSYSSSQQLDHSKMMASYMKHASRRKISPTATGTEVRASNRGQPPRPITRFQTGRVAAYTPGDLLATRSFRGTSLSADHDIFKNGLLLPLWSVIYVEQRFWKYAKSRRQALLCMHGN
jgi:hypothetical protein